MAVTLRKPARDLLSAMAAGSQLKSSKDERRDSWIAHYKPTYKLRGVKYDLVEALMNAGYISRIEMPGTSTHRYNYSLTAAGRAAVEAFNAPQETT